VCEPRLPSENSRGHRRCRRLAVRRRDKRGAERKPAGELVDRRRIELPEQLPGHGRAATGAGQPREAPCGAGQEDLQPQRKAGSQGPETLSERVPVDRRPQICACPSIAGSKASLAMPSKRPCDSLARPLNPVSVSRDLGPPSIGGSCACPEKGGCPPVGRPVACRVVDELRRSRARHAGLCNRGTARGRKGDGKA